MKDELGQKEYTHPPALDEGGLVAYVKTQPDVVAVYIFGSLAQGRATSRSDIDIAVLLTGVTERMGGLTGRQLQLMDALRRFADRAVDVVVLNTAPAVLKHQVLRCGRRIFERNQQARIEFEVRARQAYADTIPMLDFFTSALFDELKEVGLGGRRRNHQRPPAVLAQPDQVPQG